MSKGGRFAKGNKNAREQLKKQMEEQPVEQGRFTIVGNIGKIEYEGNWRELREDGFRKCQQPLDAGEFDLLCIRIDLIAYVLQVRVHDRIQMGKGVVERDEECDNQYPGQKIYQPVFLHIYLTHTGCVDFSERNNS